MGFLNTLSPVVAVATVLTSTTAFSSGFAFMRPSFVPNSPTPTTTLAMASDNSLEMIPPVDGEYEPVQFTDGTGVVDCFVDAVATINDVQYTVGHVCDNAADIVYLDEDGDLVPIEVDDQLMEEIFPVAVKALKEEFPEFELLRTPATLTLAGDLGEEEEEVEEDGDEASAELLVSFQHTDKEYMVVRPLDLMLLVAIAEPNSADQRVLISNEVAEEIMPTLMEMLGI